MKLLTKTSLIILTVALFIFFLGGVAFYKVTKTMIVNQVDKELQIQMQNIISELNSTELPKNAVFVTENKISIAPVQHDFHVDQTFRDTILFDQVQQRNILYRQIEHHAFIGNQNYDIVISQSMLEAESLVEQVVLTMTMMLLTLIVAMYFLNNYIFKKIWDEFFFSINRVQNFNFKDDPNLDLPVSEVEEFQAMNDVFEKLTERINRDYLNLKEFTENASHEIQTPLSIMRAKIELLLQEPNYSKKQIELISALNDSVSRLSNINKVLTLLTRIENNQFPEISNVDLSERSKYHLENFEEMINEKDLKVEVELDVPVKKEINNALADILIINLMKNAIRHNIQGGELKISLSETKFVISNSGPKPEIPEDQLFDRFVHGNQSSESLGLGLALVKKICELYGFSIQYRYEDNLNMITINFGQN